MRILVADRLPDRFPDAMLDAGHECEVDACLTEATLPKAVVGADVLVVRSTRVTADVFAAADALRLVVRAGSGANTIDCDEATRTGVLVANVPGRNSVAVAELTLGLLLAVDRAIPENTSELRAGRFGASTEQAQEAVLSLHVPLTPETRGMVGAEVLEAGRQSTRVQPRVDSPVDSPVDNPVDSAARRRRHRPWRAGSRGETRQELLRRAVHPAGRGARRDAGRAAGLSGQRDVPDRDEPSPAPRTTRCTARLSSGFAPRWRYPTGFEVLFLQGGALLQFAMVPMNLLSPGASAGYVRSGAWGAAAHADAQRAASPESAYLAWDGTDGEFVRMPEAGEIEVRPGTRYGHLTSNETVEASSCGRCPTWVCRWWWISPRTS